jgi:hypothetical protein
MPLFFIVCAAGRRHAKKTGFSSYEYDRLPSEEHI